MGMIVNLIPDPADDPKMIADLAQLADATAAEVRKEHPGLPEESPEFQAALVTRVSEILTMSLADLASRGHSIAGRIPLDRV